MVSGRRLLCLLPRFTQLYSKPLQSSCFALAPSPVLRNSWLVPQRVQFHVRQFSTSAARAIEPQEPPEPEKKLSIYQRFKQTYKTHGKILIAVHACTTVGWFTCFYALIRSGIDVIGILEALNVSEKVLAPVRSSSWVDVALTYLMYKLASPLRYAVTIGGTKMVVRQFRNTGRIPEMRDEDRLRNLAKESRVSMQEIAKDHRENFTQRYKARKANLSQQYRERKEHLRTAARRRLLRMRSRRKARKDSD